jgi:hypothetical protein
MTMQRFFTAVGLLLCFPPLARPQDAGRPEATVELERLRAEYADVLALDGVSKDEVLAIARLLRAKPEMAIDRTRESGEYCLKSSPDTMTHYAADATKTREDIVYEFAAAPLMSAGLDPQKLPSLPALGKMEPGQWYHLPEGQIDPHHQHAMHGVTLVIAVDVR